MAKLHNLLRNLGFWVSRKINYPLVTPDIIQISLTYRCNLRCKMCSIVNLSSEQKELTSEQVFHIINEAKDFGIKQVLLTGGEPFLRQDIFEICEYSFRQGLKNIITSNGTLIDHEMAEAIADSGVSHIHFSLDGREEANDFFRGEGAFKKIVKGIQLLGKKRNKERFFSIGIAVTIMNKNVKDLYKIVELADDLNVDSVNFQPLLKDNTNFINQGLPEFWLKNSDISILEEEILKINNFKPRYTTVYQEPRLELLVKYYQGKLTKRDWVCFGGFKTVFVCYAEGEPLVYSCHGICGNLDKTSLKKSWVSKEAYKRRLHSKTCRNLCLQTCYSKESAQHFINLAQ